MAFVAVLFGIILLVKGGDWLMRSAVALSLQIKIPKMVMGMTVVSFATSSPELIVSIQSALSGHPDLAFGNVIGSNIANLAFVLGFIILLAPIRVTSNFYKTDWPMMVLASIGLYFFVVFDKEISRLEGIVFVSTLILFIVYLIRFQKTAVIDKASEDHVVLSYSYIFWYLALGGFALWLGSEVLIRGVVSIAETFGISERIISISIISVGTSIPELSASLVAIVKKEKAISLGNLIGSNIFNIMAVLGITTIIHPIHITDTNLLGRDLIWMIGISVLVFLLVFFPKKCSWVG